MIFQADSRARSEQLTRARTIAIANHQTAQAAGTFSRFDPAKPWETAFNLVIEDSDYWRQNLEEPCFMALSKVGNVSQFLGGDAPVAGSHHAGPAAAVERERPRLTPRSGQPAPVVRTTPAARPPPAHEVDAGGLSIRNRAGKLICRNYNAGTCTETIANGSLCAADRTRVHQCARCLQPPTVCANPSTCTAPLRNAPTGPRGTNRKGGKGKGKGKSKRW